MERGEETICEMFLNDLDCYPGGLGSCAAVESLKTFFYFLHFTMLQKQKINPQTCHDVLNVNARPTLIK